MAKKSYVGINNQAKLIPNKGYVGIANSSKKLLKGYVGDANSKAQLFWTSDNREYNYHQRPALLFLPNTFYNLSKMNLRNAIYAGLKTCAYLSKHFPDLSNIINKYLNNFNTIWNYVQQSLTIEDTVQITINVTSSGNSTLALKFADTDTSNVKIIIPNTGTEYKRNNNDYYMMVPDSLRYILSESISQETHCFGVDVYYILGEDKLEYRTYDSSSISISDIGGYEFQLSGNAYNVLSPYNILYYAANNIGATMDASLIEQNRDFFLYIDCITNRVIEGGTYYSGSANFLLDDAYNYYGLCFSKDTSHTVKTSNGMEVITPWFVGISPDFLYKGIADIIIKFGNIIMPATSTGYYRDVVSLIIARCDRSGFQRQFMVCYNATSSAESWGGIGWYVLTYDTNNNLQRIFLSSSADFFSNKYLQFHFYDYNTPYFDIAIDGVPFKQNIPCFQFYDGGGIRNFSIGAYGASYTDLGGNITIEKVAVLREHRIILI